MTTYREFTVLAGTANPALAAAVSGELGVRLGACRVERFPDGGLSVRLEESVRGREVFVVQPTSPPVNEHLVGLLAFADPCRRASAARTTAVVPYFGYARADKRRGRREPITASVVADLLQTVGVARVPMAAEYARRLKAPMAVLHKRREGGDKTVVTHLAGDVRGRACLIIDDMISTGGTIAGSVEALLGAGASDEIIVGATHGLLVGGAREKLARKGVRELFVTDT